MSTFTITVVNRPRVKTAGMKVRTTMQNAASDCSALWQEQFGPRMMTFPADPAFANQSFGVSVMLDANTFDYWATMPLQPGAAVPEGMETLDVPGGLYAECKGVSLEALCEAYTYIYSEWAAGQQQYALDMSGVCYELYTSEFMQTGKFCVYAPLVKK